MASIQWDPKRQGFKLRYRSCDDRNLSIWLGGVSKRKANEILRNIEDLLEDQRNGLNSRAETVRWLKNIEQPLLRKLDRKGLVPDDMNRRTKSNYTVADYMNHVESMKSDWKPRTVSNHKQVRRLLLEYFGKDQLLANVTSGNVDSWRRWMLSEKGLAEATVGKHVKRFKAVLQFAVDEEVLEKNPAAKQVVPSQVNRERDFFITKAMADAVLKQCPDANWRLIFALCRYAGLRCPSEVLVLKWSDVLWAQDRMRIDSPKTGLRFCPMFADLKPYLADAFECAPEGSVYCVQGYRGSSSNLRTRMTSIIQSAGLKPWPKLFVNLRASCRTELQNLFPDHALDSWLGHSTTVARKHYLQVTDEHWNAAANGQGVFQKQEPTRGGISEEKLDQIMSMLQEIRGHEGQSSQLQAMLDLQSNTP